MKLLYARRRSRRMRQASAAALAGLVPSCALVVLLAMRALGFAEFSTLSWLGFAAVSVGAHLLLWAIPRYGLTELLPADRHYLFVPVVVNGWLLCSYVLLAPDAWLIPLLAFPAGLTMVAGLIGFAGSMSVNALVMLAYLSVAVVLNAQGRAERSLSFELMVVLIFLAASFFAAGVYERLKRERDERHQLQRQLSEMALTDTLTGLPNRRAFEQMAVSEESRARRRGGSFALAILDIDHFKRHNDRHGHPAGDRILQEIGDEIVRAGRTSDLHARWAGDEFVMLFAGSSMSAAVYAADRVRAAVAKRIAATEPWRSSEERITISVGVACFPQDGSTLQEVMMAADDGLYEAKRRGRNCVGTPRRRQPSIRGGGGGDSEEAAEAS